MEETTERMPLKIKKLLNELTNHSVIGLSKMKKMRVADNENVPAHGSYSYILEIPYAGSYLNWEVIFSNEDPAFAPDFDFINDEFLTDPDVDVIEKDLPALHNWDVDDAKCLCKVVREILVLYKKYQVDRLQVNKYHRQFVDYTTLSGSLAIPESDIEVHIDQNDCVHFLIILPIAADALPPYIHKYFDGHNGGSEEMTNPGGCNVTLRVSYFNTNKTQTVLWLSPRLEEIIGAGKQLRIPMFNKDNNLTDYIHSVQKLVEERLHTISDCYKLRNEFVSTMLAYQGTSVIEYDNVTFSKIVLLLETHDNHCLVTIDLGKAWDRPTVLLSSLYCETNSKPISETLTFSYDPNGKPEDHVKKILCSVYCFLSTYKAETNNGVNVNHEINKDTSYAGALK